MTIPKTPPDRALPLTRTFGTLLDFGLPSADTALAQKLSIDWSLSPETVAAIEAIDNNIRMARSLAHTVRFD